MSGNRPWRESLEAEGEDHSGVPRRSLGFRRSMLIDSRRLARDLVVACVAGDVVSRKEDALLRDPETEKVVRMETTAGCTRVNVQNDERTMITTQIHSGGGIRSPATQAR
ncbi:hypothetical protein MRB53_038937 [Persea americana]|nr:hypothetical protein MRB53_038937 [Persea americana]